MPSRLSLQAVIRWLCAVLLLSAFSTAAGAKDSWIEVRSPNFTVISNAGEKEARRVADQFEQFREVFHTTFPQLRVDLGKPLIIFVVKNEESLKALLPAYWEEKGRAHPAGIYMPGEERHYVAVRTDVQSDNPYEIVYHEYTHAIMDLNFRGLPVWLNEGLAEFYGNSTIYDKYVEVGKIAPYHLQTLRQDRLIPIEVLLQADERSPYYNEQNHASMFYAQSWAIVHYLMLDPEARKRQLLTAFLTTWNGDGDQLGAAQKTFGDLKKFAISMESYARQHTFYVGKVSTSIHGDAKSYTSRVLPGAEIDAQRAMFYAHTQRPKEATAAVEEAIKEDPNLALAYEAQGFLAYNQQQYPEAKEAFTRAIELQSTDFFPYFYAAEAKLRNGLPTKEQVPKVIASLEKAIQMNPQFAPAYAALASAYSVNPETREKAFAAGRKAAELEPGNLFYATNYGYVLANAGKTAEAKALALRIQQAAKTPADRSNAEQLLAVVANREAYDSRIEEMKARANEAESRPVVVASQRTVDIPASGEEANNKPTPRDVHRGESEYAVEGSIVLADCDGRPGKVSIAAGKTAMSFRFSDFADLQVVSTAKQDSNQPPACGAWKGRRVRIYFYKVKEKGILGELATIQFF